MNGKDAALNAAAGFVFDISSVALKCQWLRVWVAVSCILINVNRTRGSKNCRPSPDADLRCTPCVFLLRDEDFPVFRSVICAKCRTGVWWTDTDRREIHPPTSVSTSSTKFSRNLFCPLVLEMSHTGSIICERSKNALTYPSFVGRL